MQWVNYLVFSLEPYLGVEMALEKVSQRVPEMETYAVVATVA